MDHKEITYIVSIISALLSAPSGCKSPETTNTGHRELPRGELQRISYAEAELSGINETKVIPISSHAGSKGAPQSPVEQRGQESANSQQRMQSQK